MLTETTVRALAGQIIDLDSHEGIPFHLWPEHFEGMQERWAPLLRQEPGKTNVIAGQICAKDETLRDTEPYDPSQVWFMKGPGAPGTVDMGRRLEVMDVMGIQRQLVFPGLGLFGMFFAHVDRATAKMFVNCDIPADFDLAGLGRDSVEAHNVWVIKQMQSQAGSSPRLRPTTILMMDTVENTMQTLERAAAGGARAVFLRSSAPPCGMAPGDRRLDPVWRFLEEHKFAVTLHIGGDSGFIERGAWRAIPEFMAPSDYQSIEFPGYDPYTGAACHYANENFVQAMILGGVFTRFPDLRFGIIENGAVWVGGLAERLDMWCEEFSRLAAKVLDGKPSEVLNRNVRVTPFNFENVRSYFERFPHLANVYGFASDYPHVEGGKDAFNRLYDQLAPLGQDVCHKFFHENGAWLVPD